VAKSAKVGGSTTVEFVVHELVEVVEVEVWLVDPEDVVELEVVEEVVVDVVEEVDAVEAELVVVLELDWVTAVLLVDVLFELDREVDELDPTEVELDAVGP